MAGKIQNADIKSEAELVGLGADKTQLLNTTKMYSPKTTNVLENDLRKNNDAAIVAPAVTNDSSQGYEPGSRWIDTIAQKTYFCITNGVGTAIWKESGSGGGVGGVDILAVQTAENAVIGDFTQTGLEIVDSPIILHGKKSFRLIHQAASTRDFKEIIPVDSKFRGKNHTFELDLVSSALMANLTILFRDETNAADIGVSQQIQTDSDSITATVTNASNQMTGLSLTDFNKLKLGMLATGTGIPTGTKINGLAPSTLTATLSANATSTSTSTKRISSLTTKRKFTFNVATNCASISYKISALQEANLPESYIDDIIIQLTQYAKTTASITIPTITEHETIVARTTVSSFNTVNVTDTIIPFAAIESAIGSYALSSNAITIQKSGKYKITLKGEIFGNGEGVNLRVKVGGVDRYVSPVHTIDLNGSGSWSHFSDTFITDLTSANVVNAYINMANGRPAKNFEIHLELQPVVGSESKTIDLTSAMLVQQPDSFLRINGFNPSLKGSTATKIPTFTSGTIQKNIGNAFQYLDDSVNGARIIAQEEGLFTFSYSADAHAGAQPCPTGFSLNSVNLTLDYHLLPITEKLGVASDDGGVSIGQVNVEAYLQKGDIVRPHIAYTHDGADTNYSTFTVAYKGSIKQLNLSSDSKMTIPTHSLRFEGSTARGSTDTGILKFDSMTNVVGDAWDVVNTPANGTVVTMKKAGRLTVSGSIYGNATAQFWITKNKSSLTVGTPSAGENFGSLYAGSSTIMGMLGNTFDVTIGDKIRIAGNANPNNEVNLFQLSLMETSISAAFSNVLPQWSEGDSAIRVQGGNGYGSINTNVRRFSNLVDNFGSDVSYTDSASLGASFEIKTTGLYDVAFSESTPTGASNLGITKNSISLNSDANLLAKGYTSAGNPQQTATNQVYLQKGDIVRACGNGGNGTDGLVMFSISKVGKPNLTSVDVTPFVNIKTLESQSSLLAQTATFANATITGVLTSNTNTGIYSYNSTTGIYTSLKKAVVTVSASMTAATAAYTLPSIYKNNILQLFSFTHPNINWVGSVAATFEVEAGDTFFVSNGTPQQTSGQRILVTALAMSNSIATPTQQISSDTLPFTFKATAIVDADPIGTFNTYTYAANTNTATISTTPPTQTIASMNADGFRVFARAYNAASTTASPARVDIKIGKGLKGINKSLYKSTTKDVAGIFDYWIKDLFKYGFHIHTYNEKTGVLILDAGTSIVIGAAPTSAQFIFGDGGATSDGYVVFNASTTPSITALPALQPRIAYVKDVKATGSTGGSCVAGLQTRTLNDLVNNSGLGISLNANQIIFTELGTFRITGNVPAFFCSQNKAYLFNVTDGIAPASLVGSSTYSGTGTADTTQSLSYIDGEITITKTTVFELRHYTQIARSPNGLGVASISGGQIEIYSSLAIQKIK